VIINFPTGFYSLPTSPSDSESVTFTISNEEPPRTNLLFPKIPPGIIDRKRKPSIPTIVERRVSVGELIYSISRASRIKEGNNTKQYETGDILSFGDFKTKSVEPMVIDRATETRHDLNKFDYNAMGITVEERVLIEATSLVTHDDLSDKLNELKQLRADAEVDINVQQKLINETTRNIDALNIIVDNSDETAPAIIELVEKLEEKRKATILALDQSVTDANEYAAEAELVTDELRTVAVVVK